MLTVTRKSGGEIHLLCRDIKIVIHNLGTQAAHLGIVAPQVVHVKDKEKKPGRGRSAFGR